MRVATALALALILTPAVLADSRHVVSDNTVDFASIRTFAIRQGRATTTRPELTNALIFKKVEESIRAQLLSKGLKELSGRPDVVVGFTIGEDRPNGPSVTFNQGVLLIEMIARDSNSRIWQGVYRNEKDNPAKVAGKLTSQVNKLLSEYPPKKKK